MADHSRQSQDLCSFLGYGILSKAYKSLFYKRKPGKNSSIKKPKPEERLQSRKEAGKAINDKDLEVKIMNDVHNYRYNSTGQNDNLASPKGFFRRRSSENYFTNIPSPLSSPSKRRPSPSLVSRSTSSFPSLLRNASHRSCTPTPGSSFFRNMSRKRMDATSFSGPLPRSSSRKGSTPIMFSSSNGLIKPPPMEKQLDCTLEELCYGCVKKVRITRDVVTDNGQIIQEEEVLTIKVKPGWRKGTKITFEGMGNEAPGTLPAVINFVIAEKQHPLFRRDGDDLGFAIEVPLLKALTGCTLFVPLLGGDRVKIKIDDVIYPGYERVIPGQGMPKPKEQGRRGNLVITFLVVFPTELTGQQRSEVRSVLENCDFS